MAETLPSDVRAAVSDLRQVLLKYQNARVGYFNRKTHKEQLDNWVAQNPAGILGLRASVEAYERSNVIVQFFYALVSRIRLKQALLRWKDLDTLAENLENLDRNSNPDEESRKIEAVRTQWDRVRDEMLGLSFWSRLQRVIPIYTELMARFNQWVQDRERATNPTAFAAGGAEPGSASGAVSGIEASTETALVPSFASSAERGPVGKAGAKAVSTERYDYPLLELNRGASEKEIRGAFRKKALLVHPDKCAAEEKEEAEKQFAALCVEVEHALRKEIMGGEEAVEASVAEFREDIDSLIKGVRSLQAKIEKCRAAVAASEARGAAAVRAVKEEGAAAVAASEARGAAAVRAVKEEGAAAVAALEARMEAKGKAKEEKRKRRKREGRDPDESTDEEAAAGRPAAHGGGAGVAVARSVGLSVSGPALFGVSGGAGPDASGGGMDAAAPAPAAGGAGRA